MNATRPVGDLLREWRQRRRLSQLDFAVEAEISSKHLSFLETGRARPSRDMLMKLTELLDVPLRERNTLLVAAGFAPMFAERKLDDPALQSAREAMELVLKGHEPFPALAVDRHWNMLASNRAVAPFLSGANPKLLEPPFNVLRFSLHPDGLAPRIVNLGQWRAHLLARLRRQIEISADTTLMALHEELSSYPAPQTGGNGDIPHFVSPSSSRGEKRGEMRNVPISPAEAANAFVVPFRVATSAGVVLSFISTTTVFGTPIDVTLSELALETFFPADAATAAALRNLAQ